MPTKPVTRPAAAARPAVAKPPAVYAALLDLGSYGAGNFDLPEGDYAVFHDVRVHQYTKQDGSPGQTMLGVMGFFYPLGGGDPIEHFMGLGSKALNGWAPDPDSADESGMAKKLAAIPGAPTVSLGGMSGFNLYLKSIIDCLGEVPEAFGDGTDVSPIDGIWVHARSVDEPEERKSFRSSTISDQTQPQRTKKVAIVTEVKEDGKPWEGGGGMPEAAEAAPAAPAKPAPKPVAKPAAAAAKPVAKPVANRPAAKPAPAPAVEEAPEGDADVLAQAGEAITSVLSANPSGCKRLKLRNGAFTYVKNTYGDAEAQAVVNAIFGVDESALLNLLGENGFTLNGADVVAS